jgi:hypothetical protein
MRLPKNRTEGTNMKQPRSLRHDPTTDASKLDASEPDIPSSSDSGIRPRVSLDALQPRPESLQPKPSEQVTVVFRGTLPIEGLLHLIRRRAQARHGTQAVHARVEAREGAWEVALRVAGVAVVATAENPFLAALRAFDLLR